MPAEPEAGTSNTIFISHVEEDSDVALRLAFGLEEQGYATWCYEVDSIPGPSHMDQTLEAIEHSDAVVMLISPDCVRSHEVTTELTRAQDKRKPIIPLLLGLTHGELMSRRSEWGQRLGPATCLTVSGDVAMVVPRLIRGLQFFKVHPGESRSARDMRLKSIEDELAYRGSPPAAQQAAPAAPAATPSPPAPAAAATTAPEAPAGAAGTPISFPGHARHLKEVGQFVRGLLAREGLETQELGDDKSLMIQGKEAVTQKWKKALRTGLGLESAVSVTMAAKGRDLEVTIGAGKWMDKAIGGAIGAFVFWPAAVTAGWGVYKQKQLFTRLEREIGTFLAAKG